MSESRATTDSGLASVPPGLHDGAPKIALRSRTGRAIIAAAVLGSALAYMSDDMLNVALPSVSRDLQVGVSEMQWVVNGYFIAMLSLMLTAGSIGDIRGNRRTFLLGLAVFSGGAIVSATAPVVALLVAGRAVQGVGAALVLAAALALVNGTFAHDERSRAVGVYMGATAVVTAAGPVLGGLLVDLLSWRAIFVAPLMFPLAAAVITGLWVPESRMNPKRKFDVAGAALAFITISAFSFALIRGPGTWLRLDVLVGLAVAVVAARAFLRAEQRSDDPMLPLVLFRSRVFSGGSVVTLLSFMVSAGAFLFVAVQMQIALGYRPARAGAALVPIYLIMLVGSPLAGSLADRIGPRTPVVVGNVVFAGGVWWLSFIEAGSAFLTGVLPGLVVLSVGLATVGAPLTSATLGAVGEEVQGVASGVSNTVGQLGGLLMIAVLPAIAGLSGRGFDDPQFANGYRVAMQVCAALCLVAAVIAGFTIPSKTEQTESQ